VDVPAAVVCVLCGEPDCAGCDRELSRSGVIAVVAWERPGIPAWSRLWMTARGAVREPDVFFASLPDGPVLPALRFAFVCEAIATVALFLSAVPIVAIVAPGHLRHLAFDPAARELLLRALVLGVPTLAAILVAVHVAHGLALDRGARKSGAANATRRALRFGLYAAGWDLVVGPFGALVIAFREGLPAAADALSGFAALPKRSARAFLRGAYALDGERADRVLRGSHLVIALGTLVGAVAVLAAIAGLALL
jgi:hypothetical protein